MTDRDPTVTGAGPEVPRRVLLLGAGAVGVIGLLAACGGGDEATSGAADPAPADPSPSSDDDAADDDAAGAPTGGGGAGPLVAVGDVPVGGGVIIAADKIVVTQPTEGDFKGFSSTCTHQACQVNEVADGRIKCPCHGSMYSIEDGSVEAGPAPAPLPKVAVAVDGDQVVRA